MDLIIDANILFSALIKNGKTAEILSKTELILFAPEYILVELDRYRATIADKTERTDIESVSDVFIRRINIIPNDEIASLIPQAKKISPDPYDIEFFACALYMRCAIWSNDKALKQQKEVDVFSTEDLIRIFYR